MPYTQTYTVCPRSSDPFSIVTYYKKWVPTSRTDGNNVHTYFSLITFFNPSLKYNYLFHILYWVTRKLPQICTAILRIRIGKVA